MNNFKGISKKNLIEWISEFGKFTEKINEKKKEKKEQISVYIYECVNTTLKISPKEAKYFGIDLIKHLWNLQSTCLWNVSKTYINIEAFCDDGSEDSTQKLCKFFPNWSIV